VRTAAGRSAGRSGTILPPKTNPTPLGLKKSFGFGDRLGLATPGHLASARKFDFAPIFAQQSIREMQRTNRTPEEVMSAAKDALAAEGFNRTWGADADHLKTPEDVRRTAAAGFCFFTIDPSAHVNNDADRMAPSELADAVRGMVADKTFDGPGWEAEYLSRSFELDPGEAPLRFLMTPLRRAAVKYGRAVAHSAVIGRSIREACNGRPFEIEVSVDETDSPTSPLEHLFFALELKRRGVQNVVSLAPRFVGDREKGIDYRGDLAAFERSLRQHVAVARFAGPYKISVHSGSDKFSIYPIVGRVCGDLLHVKTAGTSYLEALRVVVRRDAQLFGEIAAFCHGRFGSDRASYHISTTDADVARLPRGGAAKELERPYLDEVPGRQLMHVTFGSVLTQGRRAGGQTFKDAMLDVLRKNDDLHKDVLVRHFDKHLRLLNAG
jgi:hypothetical protein